MFSIYYETLLFILPLKPYFMIIFEMVLILDLTESIIKEYACGPMS